MRQIVPYYLWIGHANDGRDHRRQCALGIRALVQVAAEEPALQPPREFLYCRFPLLDSPGNDTKMLDLAICTLASLIERRVPTLVCCGAGMSRGPAVAAVALAQVYHDPADACLKRIAEHHPADVAPGLWEEVTSLVACNPLLRVYAAHAGRLV
jgi:protein-tyrosine phosphatase